MSIILAAALVSLVLLIAPVLSLKHMLNGAAVSASLAYVVTLLLSLPLLLFWGWVLYGAFFGFPETAMTGWPEAIALAASLACALLAQVFFGIGEWRRRRLSAQD